MRHSIAGRSTVAPTTVRASFSLFAVAATGGVIREVGVFNTTSIAVTLSLVRFTNASGVGAALTKVDYDPNNISQMTGFAGHTTDGAVGSPFRQVILAPAVGSGVIWTFGDNGIRINSGTANGIGIICPIGTGQVLEYYMDWDE